MTGHSHQIEMEKKPMGQEEQANWWTWAGKNLSQNSQKVVGHPKVDSLSLSLSLSLTPLAFSFSSTQWINLLVNGREGIGELENNILTVKKVHLPSLRFRSGRYEAKLLVVMTMKMMTMMRLPLVMLMIGTNSEASELSCYSYRWCNTHTRMLTLCLRKAEYEIY